MQNRKRTFLVAVLVLFAACAMAQMPHGWSRKSRGIAAPKMSTSFPEIKLNVLVLAKSGQPENQDGSAFRVFEDGAERPIQSVGAAESPVSLLFVIDKSGSMYLHNPPIDAAIGAILKALPAGSEVAVILFQEQAWLQLPFTPAATADFSFLDRMFNQGPSAMFDAIVEGENYISTHARYSRRALVLVSDGGENSSEATRDDVLRFLEWPGAPEFYSLILNAPDDDSARGARTMEAIADAAGGVAFKPGKKGSIAASADRVAACIRSQYVLTFTTADAAHNGHASKVEVRLPGKDLRIHALHLYRAPSQ